MYPTSSGLAGFLLELQAGWNLISLPIVPVQTAPSLLLKALIQVNDLVTVWGYSTSPKPSWSFFAPPNSGTLKSMVDGLGYWVNVRFAMNITIVGYVFSPVPATPPTYPLSAGWNLLGFKPEPVIQNETVGAYLTSIAGSYDSHNVWVYANDTWIRPNSSFMLQPGLGMWIFMTSPAALRP